jgi:hypothetical protein
MESSIARSSAKIRSRVGSASARNISRASFMSDKHIKICLCHCQHFPVSAFTLYLSASRSNQNAISSISGGAPRAIGS